MVPPLPISSAPAAKPWYRRPGLIVALAMLVALWFGLPMLLERLASAPGPASGGTPADGQPSTAKPVLKDMVTADDPSLGPTTAPVVIVEFGDFQCPYCREEAPILKQVLRKYPEAIRLIYRDFPLYEHSEAIAAAEAANCAGAQGKFWNYHDLLFQRQDELSGSLYATLASSLGLDLNAFNRCRDNHLTLNEIQDDANAGLEAGIVGTPTFFVNGRKVEGVLTLELWDKVIAASLRAKFKK